jgi:hypothetical protein
MQELIQKLMDKAGLSSDQAGKSVGVVKDFVKEKFPMLGDAVDKMLGSNEAPTASNAAAAVTSEPKKEEGMLDKISDVIPGQVGEKIEDFAKGIGDKLGGIFGK